MKKAYFAISYSKRAMFKGEINLLRKLLKTKNIELFVFVEVYQFAANQEKEMMQAAFAEIDEADFLIVELTNKAIGVGVEVGYAFAKKIPIFYLRQNEAAYSTTVGGCTTFEYVYADLGVLTRIVKDFILPNMESV